MAPSAIPVEPISGTNDFKKSCKFDQAASNTAFVKAMLETDAAAALDPAYTLKEEPIGTRRPIRVVCMGAGYSGLMMAIMFSQQMQGKNAELVVYERNEDLGGTWLLNRYDLVIEYREANIY
jgi:NADPH-dependent 2,4-dienoyl-CoA reductase/sulfur reductase-like enzyme